MRQMTRSATDSLIGREARIVKELPAERRLGGRYDVVLWNLDEIGIETQRERRKLWNFGSELRRTIATSRRAQRHSPCEDEGGLEAVEKVWHGDLACGRRS